MNIEFKTKKLEKICTHINEANKAFGENIGRKLIRRLYDIQAANCLVDLSPLPPIRCHRLHGTLKQLLAIDLEQPNRLIFCAIDDSGKTLDLDKVKFSHITNIKILEVSKHYD